jgi:hypothetical protein
MLYYIIILYYYIIIYYMILCRLCLKQTLQTKKDRAADTLLGTALFALSAFYLFKRHIKPNSKQ